jgi:polyisoprenoid-binding protein YceI
MRLPSQTCSLLLAVTLLASCGTRTAQEQSEPQELPAFPLETYLSASDAKVYKIIPQLSQADIVVRRGGTLARFGHDHVVSANQITGYVLFSQHKLQDSRADLRIDLQTLLVDDPLSREAFKLDTQPSQQDIEKTRFNMLSGVLQSEQWPVTHLSIKITGGSSESLQASLGIYLHGIQHNYPVTIQTEGLATELLTAKGNFSLKQSDFGIKPFSVLGGGLKVLDQVDISFKLQASQLAEATDTMPDTEE